MILVNILTAIQNDSRLGFSVASFIRQAILERKSWMSKVCVQCTPPDHWNRNLFQHPPSVAEFPADFERTFTDGKPWFFSEHPLGHALALGFRFIVSFQLRFLIAFSFFSFSIARIL